MVRLKRCITNPHHWYSDHSASCPWCRMLQDNTSDSFPNRPGDHLTRRQTTRKDNPVTQEIHVPVEPQIPVATANLSRRWMYTGAVVAVIAIIVLVSVALHYSSIASSIPNGLVSPDLYPEMQSPSPSINQKINEGYKYFQQKEYSHAASIADEVLATDSKNINALKLKATVLRQKGDNEQSLTYFDQVLQIKPNDADAWAQKGWAYQALGRYQEQADAFDNAIRIETNIPQTKYSWYGKGQAFTSLGRYDEALHAFNNALQLDPNYVESYSQIGKIYRNQGKYSEAILAIDKTIAAKPEYGWAYTEKGWTYEKMEQWNEMLDSFETALRVGGDNKLQSQAWDGKGKAFDHLGRYDEAMSAYNMAIQLNPLRFETYTHKGKLLISKGYYREAITEFDKTIERNPAYSDAWWYKAVALESLGNHEGASTAQAKAASLDSVKYGSKPLTTITTQQTPSKPFILF